MSIRARPAIPIIPFRCLRMPSSTSRYEELARATPDVWFVGRLATYRYYNMDQVVGQALATFQQIQAGEPATREGALVSA